jgi:hypothetical protein
LSSFATNTNLASKVDKVVGKGLSSEDYSSSQTSSISGTNTDQDLSSFATTTICLASKVDKVVGKGLSSEDYSTAESQTRFNLRYQYRSQDLSSLLQIQI